MPGNTTTDEQYCSAHSRQAAEPLIASAPRTDFWVLLDYPYPMSANVLKHNQIPVEVNNYLAAVQAALPASRVLLTRKKSSKPGSTPSLILADGRDGRAMLYEIHLDSYIDLLGVDIPAIFTGSAKAPAAIEKDFIFLVCTNGKRDACCSKWGLPLFDSLTKRYSDFVRQTSHVGGHRFAPNLICLPHGIYYGRVPLVKAYWIADRYVGSQLTLDYYRGRAAYPAPVQAAERFLRLETGEHGIGAYSLEAFSSRAEDQWEVSFLGTQDHTAYQVLIESSLTGAEIFESCNAPSERKPVKEFRLLKPIQAG